MSSGACRPAQSRHADVPSSETGRTALAQMEHFVADIGSSSVQLGQLKLAIGSVHWRKLRRNSAKGQNCPDASEPSRPRMPGFRKKKAVVECRSPIRMPSTFSSAAYEEAKARHRRLSRASEKVRRAAGVAWPGRANPRSQDKEPYQLSRENYAEVSDALERALSEHVTDDAVRHSASESFCRACRSRLETSCLGLS
jgi:hypothetical protein